MEPVTTEFVRVEPGTYELVAHTNPSRPAAGRLAAHCLGNHGGVRLYAALVDESGGWLRDYSVHASSGPRTLFVPCGTLGDFGWRNVPSGLWQVWIGTQAELHANAPRFQEWVEFKPDEMTKFTIGQR